MRSINNPYEEAAIKVLDDISDQELRASVGRLFSEAQSLIDRGEVNLIILAARRLACLYQLLLGTGMPPITGGLVASDRFLDSNPPLDWSEAQVLILDDSVVVGTTLVRLHDEIADRIGNSHAVRSMSVCLDRDQSVPYLLEGINFKFFHERSHDQVEKFSTEVVIALFRNQVPYFSDFPATNPIDFEQKAWATYLKNEKWSVADVTAPLLGNSTQHALAQIPNDLAIEEFLSRLIPDVAALVDSFKIRSYTKEHEKTVRSVFVPIALLAPCPSAILDRALEAISQSIGADTLETQLNTSKWTPEAKHRLVQLYVSACVLTYIWPDIEAAAESIKRLTAKEIDTQQVKLYFGHSAEAVLKAFEGVVESYQQTPRGKFPQPAQIRIDRPPPSAFLRDKGVQEVLWETRELLAGTGLPVQPSKGELTKIGLIFAHAIASIFGYINREFEEPQRAEIAGLHSREEYNQRFGDKALRWLNQGLTMREISAALAPDTISGSPWARSIVSLGIDAGNDLGIIVPMTLHDVGRDLVYRCYRLGETAQLAESPLPRVIQEGEFRPDVLTTSVKDGFPIHNQVSPLSRRRWIRRRFERHSLDELLEIVLRAVPGRLVSSFDGTVTSVADEQFEADLFSPFDDDQRHFIMQLDQVPATDQSNLKPGAVFTWTVFEREHGGAKDRVSRLRLRSEPPLDAELLKRNALALGELAQSQDAPPR